MITNTATPEMAQKTAERDSNGRFLPGHTVKLGKTSKGSGSKPTLESQRRHFIEDYPDAYYDLMVSLYKSGKAGNSEDAKYVCNRLQGSPRQTIDQTTKHTLAFTADDLKLLALQAQDEQTMLIGEYSEVYNGSD